MVAIGTGTLYFKISSLISPSNAENSVDLNILRLPILHKNQTSTKLRSYITNLIRATADKPVHWSQHSPQLFLQSPKGNIKIHRYPSSGTSVPNATLKLCR